MKFIIEYLFAALKALFAMFGKEFAGLEEGTLDNLESMFDNLSKYEPEL